MTIVPTEIFSACGLNVKLPLLSVVIVTTTVGTGVGVGVGFGGTGVGLGLETVGVGVGLGNVGVGAGRVDVGVSPAGIDGGDNADGVFVGPTKFVLATVGAVVTVAVLLSPPQAANTINSAAIKRLYPAIRLDKYVLFTIKSASSRLI